MNQPNLQHRIQQVKNRLQAPGKQPHLQQELGNLKARSYLRTQKKAVQLPFNAAADTTISGLRNTYAQTLSSLAGQESNTRQQYGFDDQTNPYSIAAQLQTDYNQRKAGTLNSYAGSGQLYSGATQNALNADQTAYLQGTDSAARNYDAALAKIQNDRVSASNALTQGTQQADAKALQDAANATIDPSMAPALPGYVKAYEKRISQHASQLAKHGHAAKAQKLRQRLTNIP